MTHARPSPEVQAFLKAGQNAVLAGNVPVALGAFLEAYMLAPDDGTVQQKLIEILSKTSGYRLPTAITDHLADTAMQNNLDVQALAMLLSNQLEGSDAMREALDLAEASQWGGSLAATLKDKLFLLVMNKVTAISPACERLITLLRAWALHERIIQDASSPLWQTCPEAMTAIANQCFNTEYVFDVTDEEMADLAELKARIAAPDYTGAAEDCILLAMYEPLLAALLTFGDGPLARVDAAVPNWPAWAYPVWERQAQVPHMETQLRDAMPCLTPIEEGLSASISEQYEAFPYPRWQTVPIPEHPSDLSALMRQHMPHLEKASLPTGPINILFAGCGTGRQVVQMGKAIVYKNILAFDLSRTSLAHASLKAQQFDLPNVHFGQGDILRVAEWDAAFDLIVCTGVLHHMADPTAALRTLVKVSKPNTAFFLALYSERARGAVLAARQWIKDSGTPDSLEGIRTFRRHIRGLPPGDPMKSISGNREFYSASGLHDLVFNRHELRFTPLQLAALLDECGLAFAGFHHERPDRAATYRAHFPDDLAMTDLANWDLLEQEIPDLFENMMQFWALRADA